MDITRREFFGYAAGAMGMVGLSTLPIRQESGFQRWWTMYSDPTSYDSESMRGYRSVLPLDSRWASEGDPDPGARLSLVVVPYAVSLFPDVSAAASHALHRGATLLVESGAGFADDRTFRRHRIWVSDYLQTRVCAPVDPWANRSAPGARYIEFTWPRRARIRDFGGVVALADEEAGEVIAWAGDLPVACRRKVGKGTLIYLGSPVGPALWAEDVQAQRWLDAVVHAA